MMSFTGIRELLTAFRFCNRLLSGTIIFTISWLGLKAQPASNPFEASNNALDVFANNLICTDSAFYYCAIFTSDPATVPIAGTYIISYSYQGTVKDSLLIDFLPDMGNSVLTRGFIHNDSLTYFVSKSSISFSTHYIVRISKDLKGYRYAKIYKHHTPEGRFYNIGYLPTKNVYFAHMDRMDRFQPKESIYLEITTSNLRVVRTDTLVVPSPVSVRGMTDLQYYNGHYYSTYRAYATKYSTSMDSIGAIMFMDTNYLGKITSSIPRNILPINNKLYLFGNWSNSFDQKFYKSSLMVIDAADSSWSKLYSNPDSATYIEEYIDGEGIINHRSNFILISNLNISKPLGSFYGQHKDVLIRLIDTSSLSQKHQYIIRDSCEKFVTEVASTPFGFAVLYNSYCYEPDLKGTVKVAFFNDKAELLSTTSLPQRVSANIDLKLFPNPAQDHFQVSLPENFTNKNWTLTLLNETGGQVRLIEGFGRSHNIDVSELPRGSYLLILRSESGLQSAKKIVLSE